MTAAEFARPERLDAIGAAPRAVTVAADADERRRLAGRFGLVAIARLAGDFTLRQEALGVRVAGRVTAAVTQACSITGDPLAAAVDEAVDLLFVAPPAAGAAEDELELTDATIDVVFHDGAAIDLGETAAETMALALDPFPRGPGADAALAAAGVGGAAAAGPFGALAGLVRPPAD